MDYYFARYGDLDLHRRMVFDRWRTDAYAAAIREVVKEGDRVLDVGTGTGLLAMLAAKAGAAEVHGIDYADVVQVAANLVKANGLGDRVRILRGAAAEMRLEAKADVIVSEWLGNFAFVETMLDDLVAAREANLAPGGRMIPGEVAVLLAPLDDSALYHSEGPGRWRRPVHGLDFTRLEGRELDQGRAVQLRVDAGGLLADGLELVRVDLHSAAADAPFVEGRVEYELTRDGSLNGFAGWFVADLSPNVSLDTGPYQPETHWAQTYLPFPPRLVSRGERLAVDFALARDPDEPRYLRLSLDAAGHRQTFKLE